MKVFRNHFGIILTAALVTVMSLTSFAEETDLLVSADAVETSVEAAEAAELIPDEITEDIGIPAEDSSASLLSNNGTFTVEFDSNGGSSINSQVVNSGAYAQKPENPPFRHSYVFDYWYAEDPDQEFIFNTTPITKDTTLYAKWLPVGWNNGRYLRANGTYLKSDWKAKGKKLLYVNADGNIVRSSNVPFEGKTYKTDADGALILDSADAKNLYCEKFATGEDSPEALDPQNVAFLDEYRAEIFTLDAPAALNSTYAIDPVTRTEYHGDNGWICYPAERLVLSGHSKYEKYGTVFFFYGDDLKKVKGTTKTIAGNVYRFDDLGANTNGFLTIYANNDVDETPVVKEYNCGDSVSLNACPFKKTSYHCIGYNTSPDGSGDFYEIDSSFRPVGDMTFYCIWAINDHAVTFDVKGRCTPPSPVRYNVGDYLVKPSNPTSDNYEFNGWYKDTAGVEPWVFDTDVMPDHDITLYAKWTYIPPKRPYDDGGGSSSTYSGIGIGPVFFTGTPNNPVVGTWWADYYGKWHFRTDRTFANTWAFIAYGNGHKDWFWFDRAGVMATGWQLIHDKWYFLNPLANETYGACQLGGVTPDGYTLNPDGSWTGH